MRRRLKGRQAFRIDREILGSDNREMADLERRLDKCRLFFLLLFSSGAGSAAAFAVMIVFVVSDLEPSGYSMFPISGLCMLMAAVSAAGGSAFGTWKGVLTGGLTIGLWWCYLVAMIEPDPGLGFVYDGDLVDTILCGTLSLIASCLTSAACGAASLPAARTLSPGAS